MYPKDNIFKKKLKKTKIWKFDKQISKVFHDMKQRSIPGYFDILYMIGLLTKIFVKPNTIIYDIGCSLGEVSIAVSNNIKAKGCKILAIDQSSSMIKYCRKKVKYFDKKNIIKVIKKDIFEINIKNASMVILNFTLQFIPKKNRLLLLNNIYKGINPGGILIISEKFHFLDIKINNLMFKMHHDFKKSNGYSELEIQQKHKLLKKNMLINSIDQHKKNLKLIGFSHVDLWFQYFNFGSIIAIKKQYD